MRRITALFLFVAGLLLSAGVSAQSMEQQMDQMFGQMSSVTKPQVVSGAQRGVVSGGSIAIRSPIVNTNNIVNFSPPAITAGCGGIDIYGGSFSYISGQQFVQMLRSIASNAEGLAFQMALEAMSNQLSQHLTSFSDKMEQMVGTMKNSCAIAQAGVQGAAKLITNQENQVGESLATSTGAASDSAQAMQLNTPNNSLLNQIFDSNSQLINNLVYANIVWQAINTNQTSQTFSVFGSGSTLNQEMMSITGTIIVCQPNKDPNCTPSNSDGTPNNQSQTSIKFVPPTIHLQDLLFGTTSANGQASGTQFLKCDEATRCMNPTASAWTNPGYLTLVNNMLGTDGASGIVGNLIQGTALTSQQQAFASATNPAVPLLFEVAGHNPTAAAGFAQQMATPLALELAYQHGMGVINMVSSALRNVQSAGKDDLIKDLNTVRMQWITDYNNMRNQANMGVDYQKMAELYLQHSGGTDLYAPQNVGQQ